MPTITLDKPEFCFLSISLIYIRDNSKSLEETDLLTWRQLVATALNRDHGLLGSSIHVDILHHQQRCASDDEKIVIRVPRVDKKMVWNSISGWHDPATNRALRVLKVSDHLCAVL